VTHSLIQPSAIPFINSSFISPSFISFLTNKEEGERTGRGEERRGEEKREI